MVPVDVHAGMVLRHHSGRVYTVIAVANHGSTNIDKFPLIVVYRGANGAVWARSYDQMKTKFTVLFDGNNLAENPYA